MSIKVLLAGDHRILREGLRSLLAGQSDIEVTGEASDPETTIAMARQLKPDIVVLEAEIAGAKGVEITRLIRGELPSVKVIAHSAPAGRRMLAEMLRAGASGYLDRESGSDELIQALRSVAGGRPYLGPVVADRLIEEFTHQTAEQPAEPRSTPDPPRAYAKALTAREVEVLRLLATGKRVKEIARLLHISVKTVESHRQNMMDKLEIHSAIELVRYALREGLATI
ncbi:MAG TPA: response regulator transcription factor [Bryobacteraceae bacterium]|nr:response regulator transcription factor [Bryobacteraceae bacterium]